MVRASMVWGLSLKAVGPQWAWCAGLRPGAAELGGGESQSSMGFLWCFVLGNLGPSPSQSSSWVCTSAGDHLHQCQQQQTDLTEAEVWRVSGGKVLSSHPPQAAFFTYFPLSIYNFSVKVSIVTADLRRDHSSLVSENIKTVYIPSIYFNYQKASKFPHATNNSPTLLFRRRVQEWKSTSL